MTDPLDLDALDDILKTMGSDGFDDNPGGETDWIAALSAWTVDEGERLDPAKLAQKLATIWQVGNLVEKELSGRFQIRATWRSQFPYRGGDGELKGGCVDVHDLHLLSEDPREIACAIAAEVRKTAEPEHNVVLFRRLVTKVTQFTNPLTYRHETSFGLARVE